MRYGLSPNPVFWTIQGEGHLRGFQMSFVRLAGCSVGCAECDTNYQLVSKASADEILELVRQVRPAADRDRWVWITGGEPTDYNLRPLLSTLKGAGFSTALATSGSRRFIPPVDWLSVSPHGTEFQQRYGNELKVVDGLGGVSLTEWYRANPDESNDFMYRYVQPLWKNGQEDPESLGRCKAFLDSHPNWALSRQDHKYWGVA